MRKRQIDITELWVGVLALQLAKKRSFEMVIRSIRRIGFHDWTD